MGYEHPNTTPKMESDEIIKSGVKELVLILSENEVTSEDKKECDMPVCENYPICDDHYEIFSDSKNDDDISSDDDDFEDIDDDSIPFPNNESSEFDIDNPSFPRPPPKPPDVELDSEEEISVVMNDNDELE
nr:hypothetical protein [Tanacetum cinerariifolium]